MSWRLELLETMRNYGSIPMCIGDVSTLYLAFEFHQLQLFSKLMTFGQSKNAYCDKGKVVGKPLLYQMLADINHEVSLYWEKGKPKSRRGRAFPNSPYDPAAIYTNQ